MKNIHLKGSKLYITRFRLIGWLHGKFFLFKRIRTTYLIGDNGNLLPIKTEFVKY